MIRTFLTLILVGWIAPAWAQQLPPSPLPDPRVAPGLVADDGHNPRVLCGRVGGETYTVRHRSGTMEASLHCPKGWQADDRVPIAAGGADELDNLWCQPPDKLAGAWGWKAKDLLDTWGWRQICQHHADPASIQAIYLRPDWRVEWCNVFAGECEQ